MNSLGCLKKLTEAEWTGIEGHCLPYEPNLFLDIIIETREAMIRVIGGTSEIDHESAVEVCNIRFESGALYPASWKEGRPQDTRVVSLPDYLPKLPFHALSRPPRKVEFYSHEFLRQDLETPSKSTFLDYVAIRFSKEVEGVERSLIFAASQSNTGAVYVGEKFEDFLEYRTVPEIASGLLPLGTDG